MGSGSQPPDDPKKQLKKEIEKLGSGLDALHVKYHRATQFAGYTKEQLAKSVPVWVSIADDLQKSKVGRALLFGAVDNLRRLNQVIQSENEKAAGLVSDIGSLSLGSTVFASSTGAVAHMVGIESSVYLLPSPHNEYQKQEKIAHQLEAYDPELGRLYRQADDVLYVTRSGPERPVLLVWRQFFDHLFDKIAPDEGVRRSPFFQRKKGKDPNQVTRVERMKYAVHTHVKDPAQAHLLASQAEQVYRIYKALNRLHKRGPLDPEQSRSTVESMKYHMLQWAVALGIVKMGEKEKSS